MQRKAYSFQIFFNIYALYLNKINDAFIMLIVTLLATFAVLL